MLKTEIEQSIQVRRDPVFIVGYGRSGTSLLRLMLNAHPQISIAPELRWFPLYNLKLLTETIWNSSYIFSDASHKQDLSVALKDCLPEQSDLVFALYGQAWAEKSGKKDARWGDKYTANWQFIPRLAGWYPQAQFIHIVRDPRDVVSSIVEHFPGNVILPQRIISSHINLAWRWRKSYRVASHCGHTIPMSHKRYMVLKYEDLVSDPKVSLGQVCKFLNIDFLDAMLSCHQDVRKGHVYGLGMRTHAELKNRPHTGRIGRHSKHLSVCQVKDIENMCKNEMKDMGYIPFTQRFYLPASYRLAVLSALFGVGWIGVRLCRRIQGRL